MNIHFISFLFFYYKGLTDMEFSQMLDGAPLDPKGNLDYAAFTRQIKRGKEDE
jgi:Ca2+-binding EF-hand superfamily protein